MCLFKYKEKRYGKLTLILVSLALIALAAASVWGGVYALKHMVHWSRYIIIVVASIVGLGLLGFGGFMFSVALSMSGKSKSVRDGNKAKGISGTRLCDVCGRVISKKAEFCEHCGDRQQTGLGVKPCPNCKTKNSATAAFCEKCGTKF